MRISDWNSDVCSSDLDPVVSVYWPIRDELDLIPWMRGLVERGIRVALPVVEERAQPLTFRQWRPGCRMERGVWGIPVPAEGERMTPDLRSEEHTSELQSLMRISYAVFCLKKKKK